eukprot:GHVU01099390.1.p1 GENE.GHVU01099390.1~~GHVU01099390.1.p1  ORF type:complete len:131 (-),score=15.08 GHVU01099390.1:101-493(-)
MLLSSPVRTGSYRYVLLLLPTGTQGEGLCNAKERSKGNRRLNVPSTVAVVMFVNTTTAEAVHMQVACMHAMAALILHSAFMDPQRMNESTYLPVIIGREFAANVDTTMTMIWWRGKHIRIIHAWQLPVAD